MRSFPMHFLKWIVLEVKAKKVCHFFYALRGLSGVDRHHHSKRYLFEADNMYLLHFQDW